MENKENYNEEISAMMFGFAGHHAHPETVRLVESIVQKQLRQILQEALKYSENRGTIKGAHLVFLLRHDKHKMRRFLRYLHNKHLKAIVNNVNAPTFDVEPIPRSKLIDFIERIDETGEFCDLTEVDDVKLERQLRAERISDALGEKNYLEFANARMQSFASRGMSKDLSRFKNWLNEELVFEDESLEVLSYFAFETVAQLVDYALLIRLDKKCALDPIKDLRGSYYSSTLFNGEQLRNKLDYSKVFNSEPSISVNEIKEVMRRIYNPQKGFLCFGGKLPETHFLLAL